MGTCKNCNVSTGLFSGNSEIECNTEGCTVIGCEKCLKEDSEGNYYCEKHYTEEATTEEDETDSEEEEITEDGEADLTDYLTTGTKWAILNHGDLDNEATIEAIEKIENDNFHPVIALNENNLLFKKGI